MSRTEQGVTGAGPRSATWGGLGWESAGVAEVKLQEEQRLKGMSGSGVTCSLYRPEYQPEQPHSKSLQVTVQYIQSCMKADNLLLLAAPDSSGRITSCRGCMCLQKLSYCERSQPYVSTGSIPRSYHPSFTNVSGEPTPER